MRRSRWGQRDREQAQILVLVRPKSKHLTSNGNVLNMGCQVRISMALWFRPHTMPAPLPVLLAAVLPARAPHVHSPVVTPGHAFHASVWQWCAMPAHGLCLPSVQAMVSSHTEMTTSHNHAAGATSSTSSPYQSRCAATVRITSAYAACVGCLQLCILTVRSRLGAA